MLINLSFFCNSMIISGTDEAGRGPVIGPMVMAIATIDEKDEHRLQEIGVRDSKLIPPEKRELMFDQLKGILKQYEIIILSPQEIDDALNDEKMNLNWLEAHTTAKLINKIKADSVVVDCPSNNVEAYTDYMKKLLDKDHAKMKLIVEHQADANYLIAGAASILAKVTRDREIQKIKDSLGVELGSGYPSDPVTVRFLKENFDKYPDIFRKTWKSYKKVMDESKQRTLF